MTYSACLLYLAHTCSIAELVSKDAMRPNPEDHFPELLEHQLREVGESFSSFQERDRKAAVESERLASQGIIMPATIGTFRYEARSALVANPVVFGSEYRPIRIEHGSLVVALLAAGWPSAALIATLVVLGLKCGRWTADIVKTTSETTRNFAETAKLVAEKENIEVDTALKRGELIRQRLEASSMWNQLDPPHPINAFVEGLRQEEFRVVEVTIEKH